jgi:hypothetical protein
MIASQHRATTPPRPAVRPLRQRRGTNHYNSDKKDPLNQPIFYIFSKIKFPRNLRFFVFDFLINPIDQKGSFKSPWSVLLQTAENRRFLYNAVTQKSDKKSVNLKVPLNQPLFLEILKLKNPRFLGFFVFGFL